VSARRSRATTPARRLASTGSSEVEDLGEVVDLPEILHLVFIKLV
jgi:hypothetical protein